MFPWPYLIGVNTIDPKNPSQVLSTEKDVSTRKILNSTEHILLLGGGRPPKKKIFTGRSQERQRNILEPTRLDELISAADCYIQVIKVKTDITPSQGDNGEYYYYNDHNCVVEYTVDRSQTIHTIQLNHLLDRGFPSHLSQPEPSFITTE